MRIVRLWMRNAQELNRKNSRPAAFRGARYNGRVSFKIRPFQTRDFDTLWGIDQICFEPPLAYSKMELAVYMRRAGSFTLVAEIADVSGENRAGVLGFVVAESRRKSGHIITIDVIPEARRNGLGSALLSAAESRLRSQGALEVALETAVNNLSAIRFYKKHGYFIEKTIPGYYSNHLDALVMKKELSGEAVSSP